MRTETEEIQKLVNAKHPERGGEMPGESHDPATLGTGIVIAGHAFEGDTLLRMMIEHNRSSLPSPEALMDYEKVCPGAAARILLMAEKEQNHRHKGDVAMLFAQPRIFRSGQKYAFLVCLVSIAGAVVLGLNGQGTVALGLGAGPPIVLAAGFLGRKLLGNGYKWK